jgi:hypothetical protein
VRPALAAAALAVLASSAAPLSAQVIRDDFSGPTISAEKWLFCERDENEFSIVHPRGSPFRAAEMTVHPRVDMSAFALTFRHPGCRNGGGVFEPEKDDERAELWEADAITLPSGTEVWYRFSFMVDPALPLTAGRLVIGQWKQTNIAAGDRSPVIAQRFNGRVFAITIEQDNTAPNHAPADTQCRIWIAVDINAARSPGASEAHRLGLLGNGEAPQSGASSALPSLAHDELEVFHGAGPTPGAQENPASCAHDVAIKRYDLLPDPFGHWVEMTYHMHLNGPSSLLEIWADGRPIVTVQGRIGFRTEGTGRQYFKFGPYRNHQPQSTFARLARYARGFSREDIAR